MQVQVAKAATPVKSLTAKIHEVVERIMDGEADPRRARAVLAYLAAQQRFVDASRAVGHLEAQMASALNHGGL